MAYVSSGIPDLRCGSVTFFFLAFFFTYFVDRE